MPSALHHPSLIRWMRGAGWRAVGELFVYMAVLRLMKWKVGTLLGRRRMGREEEDM